MTKSASVAAELAEIKSYVNKIGDAIETNVSSGEANNDNQEIILLRKDLAKAHKKVADLEKKVKKAVDKIDLLITNTTQGTLF